MDVGRSFSFVFSDPRWVSKLLIAALMVLIPIFGWLVLVGYFSHVTRRIATTGTDLPLPEWEAFGDLFVDGFKVAAAGFVWSLPVSILGFCLGGIFELGDGSDAGALVANCITVPLSLLVAFVAPAVTGRVAATGSFSEGLQVKQVIAAVRRNPGDYLIIVLMTFVAGFVAAAGFLALCIGVLVTIPYAQLILFHLYGQAHWRSAGAVSATQSVPRF